MTPYYITQCAIDILLSSWLYARRTSAQFGLCSIWILPLKYTPVHNLRRANLWPFLSSSSLTQVGTPSWTYLNTPRVQCVKLCIPNLTHCQTKLPLLFSEFKLPPLSFIFLSPFHGNGESPLNGTHIGGRCRIHPRWCTPDLVVWSNVISQGDHGDEWQDLTCRQDK